MTKCWCGRTLLVRQELSNRREGENIEFEHKGHRYYASIRYYHALSFDPAEIFLNSAKIDSDHDLAARDAAILASIALQHGVPLRELAEPLGRDADGSATTAIGKLLDLLLKREGERDAGKRKS